MYRFLAQFMPEISNKSNTWFCPKVMASALDGWTGVHYWALARDNWDNRPGDDAGKLMGYAATGNASSKVRFWMRKFFEKHSWITQPWNAYIPNYLLRILCGPVEGHRNVAAAIQAEFESFVHGIISELLERSGAARYVEGIVLTGGCALNVLVNQMIQDTLTTAHVKSSGVMAKRLPRDLYVPPAPNDSGLAVGGLWAVDPPLVPQKLQYLGFHLWDKGNLDLRAREWRPEPDRAGWGGVSRRAACGWVRVAMRIEFGYAQAHNSSRSWPPGVRSTRLGAPVAVRRARLPCGARASEFAQIPQVVSTCRSNHRR